jgi:hypothetical protein
MRTEISKYKYKDCVPVFGRRQSPCGATPTTARDATKEESSITSIEDKYP